MRLKNSVSVIEIANWVGAELIGDRNIRVERLCELHKIKRGSLVFVEQEERFNQALYSSAVALLVPKKIECPADKAILVVENPFKAYNEIAEKLSPFVAMHQNISPTAQIGKNTIIEAGAIIGEEVVIGEDCLIRANTVICGRTIIGNRVVIESNSTIGSDAFCFRRRADGSLERWNSIGRVILSDGVEIGSNCTIDRGITADTVIGTETKIDNHVHVGHDVEIGKHCLIAAQAGIAGKAIIQDFVTIYGQVGISEGVIVGEGAILLAKAGVSKSIPGGKTYFGSPATEVQTSFREIAALRRLPDLLKELNHRTDYHTNEDF